MEKDFKDTLLMPQTEFPMRGNLGVNEPNIQKNWEEEQLYFKRLEKNKGKKEFYLHDGPPYANGSIHVGHALNKILKDFIVRYMNMNGYYAPYQPGWDTHGLPIETALTKNSKINRKEMSVAAFRSLCEEYALKQVELQKAGFKRLGVLGDFDDPYITLKHEYEAEQIRVFGKMAERGLIFKGLKPVYWSPSSETALAEAEIEYQDVPVSSIYVAFPVEDGKGILDKNVELVIWTTTPWTIPANLAICAGPKFEYSVVKVNNRHFLLASAAVESFAKLCEWDGYEIEKTVEGSLLEGITYNHLLMNRICPVILGDHVTLDTGTGLVHTAPAHGDDDFNVGKLYNLPIIGVLDSKGCMNSEAKEFEGLYFEDANDKVIERLIELNMMLKLVKFTHSYPHDWRTKKPIVFRATPQWFASIEPIKQDILEAIKGVHWVPEWGEVRLSNMIKDRKDWCISRQRVWGVPIPVFYAEDGTPILEKETIDHVADLFAQFGSNVWFEREAKDLLPKGYKHPGSPNGLFTKENDIMDVWFDSGSSHHCALMKKYGTPFSDLYLEGSDQYRGWFNSSLITSVALENKAPFKTVISHGFTLDEMGRKMSKSLGNTVDPLQVCNESGADILRLWVASVFYQADVAISKNLIRQVGDSYRKIRNTFRFLLANVFDYDDEKNSVPYEKLGSVDKFILCKLDKIVKDCHKAYEEYRFDEVYRSVLNFMSNELSSFYLDYTKDILYIEEANNKERRNIQTVFFKCITKLATILTPILPHTMDEVYKYLPMNNKEVSIYLCEMAKEENYPDSEDILAKFDKFMNFRLDILKALEEARNQKIIGKSLNASVSLELKSDIMALLKDLNINLAQVFIVSKLVFVEGLKGDEYPCGKIKVEACTGSTCLRCWQIKDILNPDGLCERCARIVKNYK